MKTKIILGSQSPRRQQILQDAGFDIEIVVPDVEEVYPETLPLEKVPEYLAELKLHAIYKPFESEDCFILTADTMLLFEGKLIGKPNNNDEALKLLTQLNNTSHNVLTGVCLRKQHKQISFTQTTKVYFKNLSQSQILDFIDNNNVLDKAGAYNIQEYIGVDKIEGDYNNVVGLPILAVLEQMKNWN